MGRLKKSELQIEHKMLRLPHKNKTKDELICIYQDNYQYDNIYLDGETKRKLLTKKMVSFVATFNHLLWNSYVSEFKEELDKQLMDIMNVLRNVDQRCLGLHQN